ncbi:772_t:CDS:2 [Acaulospora colombiana]|uniref:772_t:CDS:1 n=1 Tax=Acaulospora colombiana TaxID=27376 RepID=A0ACA9LAD6_9GLOM|nr:772_t:CDS:2 [Acaulospora colombiana]
MSPVSVDSDNPPSPPPPDYNFVNSLITEKEQDEKLFTESSFNIKDEEENDEEGHETRSRAGQQYESQPVTKVANDSSWTEKKPALVLNHQKFDFIDFLDSTGGLVHHESPYDCTLPHRNSNSKAPILAFKQTDDIIQSITQRDQDLDDKSDKNLGNRYTSYGTNYRDSFLEGSAAYGIQPSRNPEKAKRNSIFDRTLSLRRSILPRRKNKDSQAGEKRQSSWFKR